MTDIMCSIIQTPVLGLRTINLLGVDHLRRVSYVSLWLNSSRGGWAGDAKE